MNEAIAIKTTAEPGPLENAIQRTFDSLESITSLNLSLRCSVIKLIGNFPEDDYDLKGDMPEDLLGRLQYFNELFDVQIKRYNNLFGMLNDNI